MYCLISKPVFKFTPEKVTIQLFYYLNIPKKKVFKLFSIFYIKSFHKSWLNIKSQQTKYITNFIKFKFIIIILLRQFINNYIKLTFL